LFILLGGLSFKVGMINGHLEKDVNYYAYTWQIESGLLERRTKASTKLDGEQGCLLFWGV
jgi:hypothetical protein